MQIDLGSKSALITGSSAGIGFAIAKGLAKAGAAVILNGRGQAGVDKAVARLKADLPNAEVRGIAADAATAKGCAEIVAKVSKVDILINNMGIYAHQEFFDISDEEWQRFFDVNVMSGVRLTRALMPAMMEQGWGRVVFISSESGVGTPTEMIHYGFTKTAQLALSRGLAKLAGNSGVTVNSVLPGPTLSEGVEALITSMAHEQGRTIEDVGAEFMRTMRPTSILGRLERVDEVANMVVYLCSPQASATIGAALRVDGGVVDSIL